MIHALYLMIKSPGCLFTFISACAHAPNSVMIDFLVGGLLGGWLGSWVGGCVVDWPVGQLVHWPTMYIFYSNCVHKLSINLKDFSKQLDLS